MRRRMFITGTLAGTAGLAMPLFGAQRGKPPAAKDGAQLRGYKRRAKRAIREMITGNSKVGALVLVNEMDAWADYVEDNGVNGAVLESVKRLGRRRGVSNHAEAEQLAKDLGVDDLLSPHIDPVFDVDAVYTDILTGPALSDRMRAGAAQIVEMAKKWPDTGAAVPLRYGGAPETGRIVRVQFPAQDCPVCRFAESQLYYATMLCEAMLVVAAVPALQEAAAVACGSAMAEYYMLQAACQLANWFGCN